MRVALTKELRAKIFERDDFTCQYCGRSAPDVALEIDHVIPISKGGTNDENNLVTSCRVCNVRKRDYDCTDELKQKLKELAHKPAPHIHKRTQGVITTYSDFYYYPAIFTFYDNENGQSIGITFPDFPGCVSCAKDIPDAMYMASDALGVWISDMEENNEPLPEPSDLITLKYGLDPNRTPVIIPVFMPAYRDAVETKAVNKMVTLPQWVISAGKQANLNLSRILKEAVIEKLTAQHKARKSLRRR